jgi:hypothetical protein
MRGFVWALWESSAILIAGEAQAYCHPRHVSENLLPMMRHSTKNLGGALFSPAGTQFHVGVGDGPRFHHDPVARSRPE